MQTINRNEVQTMMQQRPEPLIIEVLSEKNYEEFHLPTALNAPLDPAFDQTIQEVAPNKTQPVIVYCKDADCDASPKAAAQMEKLGYQNVFDYEAGKDDWAEAGLPTE